MTTPQQTALDALQKIAEWDCHDVSMAVDFGSNGVRDFYRRIALDAVAKLQASPQAPIPMVLHCPKCHTQHIDAPEPSKHPLPGLKAWGCQREAETGERCAEWCRNLGTCAASIDKYCGSKGGSDYCHFCGKDGHCQDGRGGNLMKWDNPPHRSHLCHNCGVIWRPADVATVGVASIETKGKADTWQQAQAGQAAQGLPFERAEYFAKWHDDRAKEARDCAMFSVRKDLQEIEQGHSEAAQVIRSLAKAAQGAGEVVAVPVRHAHIDAWDVKINGVLLQRFHDRHYGHRREGPHKYPRSSDAAEMYCAQVNAALAGGVNAFGCAIDAGHGMINRCLEWCGDKSCAVSIGKGEHGQATHAPAPVALPMTEEHAVLCLVKAGCIGTVKMSYDTGPYGITRTSINADKLIRAVEAHHGITTQAGEVKP